MSRVLRNSDFVSSESRKDWEENLIVESCPTGEIGLGFGVGKEKIPSRLAALGCYVLATDQAENAPNAKEYWGDTGQLATSVIDLCYPDIVSHYTFMERVTFDILDMNEPNVPVFGTFDFLWSCGSLEHLGSLEKSMTFIVNSLQYLKPEGVALHTTEFNLEWNDIHVAEGPNVFFRKRDILELEERLNAKGYTLMPCDFETDLTPDQVDRWPYPNASHRVLESTGVITTSIFLKIQPIL